MFAIGILFSLTTVIILPLVSAFWNYGYEHSKVLVFICAVIIYLPLELLRKRNPVSSLNLLHIFAGIFVISLVLTSLTGVDFGTSLFGDHPYYQGIILYILLFSFSIIVSSLGLSRKIWVYMLSVAGTLVGLVALVQYLGIYAFGMSMPTYASRVISTFGQPNLYSGFILLTLPFSFNLAAKKGQLSTVFLLGSVISLLGIIVSASRISIFLAGIVSFFACFNWCKQTSKKLLIVCCLGVCVLILLLTPYFVRIVKLEFVEPQTNSWLIHNGPEKRVVIWPVLLEIISRRLQFGYGLDNIGTVFDDYKKEGITQTRLGIKNIRVDRAHNYSLDLVLFSGILGFLTWLMLVFQLYYRIEKGPFLSALVLYLLWSQFQIQSVVHLIFFWLLIGLFYKKNQAIDKGAVIELI